MLRAKGATEALQVAARRLAALRPGLAVGGGLSALSYAGASPERPFGDAARRALERLDAATAVLAALHAEAAEEERPCERGAAPFVVVFEGAYVKARSRPSLASPVTRTLRRGQRFVAEAGGVFVY